MNVPRSKKAKQKTVETLIQETADDDRLRWKRAGVGGGIAGAVISGYFRFLNDAEQLAWMGGAIVGCVAIGLVTEWIHPWASEEPNRFLELVVVIWPAVNCRVSNHVGYVSYRFDLLGSIHDETEQLRIFFNGLENLNWKLTDEKDSTRSYRRRNQRLRVSLGTTDQSCHLTLAVGEAKRNNSSLS